MAWTGSYEQLRGYLRKFTNFLGDPGYDTNGILSLMMALVDNLNESPQAMADLPELSETLTPEQAAFLEQLLRWAVESQLAESNDSTNDDQ